MAPSVPTRSMHSGSPFATLFTRRLAGRVSHRDLVQILQKLENLTVNKVLDRQRHLTQKPWLHGNKSS